MWNEQLLNNDLRSINWLEFSLGQKEKKKNNNNIHVQSAHTVTLMAPIVFVIFKKRLLKKIYIQAGKKLHTQIISKEYIRRNSYKIQRKVNRK